MSHPTEATTPPQNVPDDSEFEALTSVVRLLQKLGPEARHRILGAAVTFLGIPPVRTAGQSPSGSPSPVGDYDLSEIGRFSENRTPTPKDFLFEKRPQTDIERIACLAYYLTHYRDTPHFRTLDLSKLNTEAAQRKLSNAANSVENAAKAGMLVPALNGAKQLSHMGELYVQSLPDRAAARAAVPQGRPKKKSRRPGKSVFPSAQESIAAEQG